MLSIRDLLEEFLGDHLTKPSSPTLSVLVDSALAAHWAKFSEERLNASMQAQLEQAKAELARAHASEKFWKEKSTRASQREDELRMASARAWTTKPKAPAKPEEKPDPMNLLVRNVLIAILLVAVLMSKGCR